MQYKSLGGLVAAAALGCAGLLAGCSTPCDAPGRLCAPIEANTSMRPARPAPPPAAPLPERAPAAAPKADVQTTPIDAPPPSGANQGSNAAPAGATGVPIRIALLLPLKSDALGVPAGVLRAGFMAAWERDKAGVDVTVVATDGTPQQALDAYAGAVAHNDILVGPLGRAEVTAVASSPLLNKPTLALNRPDSGGNADIPLPPRMLVMGLSIEDEARQVATWAGREQAGAGAALVVSGASAWQRRIASAFAEQWKLQGRAVVVAELPAIDGDLSDMAINQLKARIDAEPPALLFTALDAEQARQLRAVLGNTLPCYGTSSVNPGSEPGAAVAGLDGLRLLDMPWELQPDHPAVMVYPRWIAEHRTLDLDRLYALGIDAFRVAREAALHPGTSFVIDGVTGKLSVGFGDGQAHFERILPVAVYQSGAFKLVLNRP
jgi:outer membrane PBP1 activator LpoA protein